LTRVLGVARHREVWVIQKTRQMHDPRARSRGAQTGRDLEHAARIRADDHVRRHIEDLPHFVPLKLARYLGVGQVVDAGAAATALRVVDVEKDHALDRPQEGARLRPDALPVGEVTRVLIDDADRPPGAPRNGLHDLADIADPRGEGLGAVRPERVGSEDMAVVLEVGAAPRRVDDHLRIATRKGIDVVAGELARAVAVARVRVQRAAAGLLFGHGHDMSIPLEKTDGRSLGISERLSHDAAREYAQIRALALNAAERRAFRRRRKGSSPPETARQYPRRETGQSETSTEIGQARREGQPAGTRDGIEGRSRKRTAVFALAQDLARALHDPTERNSRRACGLARPADEARLEMPDGRFARRDRIRDDRADQLDASARRIRLIPEHAIGRAIVETEPARDARGEILGADAGGRESDVPSIRTMAIGTASIAARLREVIPADRVIDDPSTLLPYSYDASFWSLRQQRTPSAVVVPETTAEVVAAIRVANETDTPIVPRGAGTGQTGGAIAPEGGIVISFARMRKIVEIDRRNLQAVVEPGLVYFDFQNALADHGLFFPPDPGSGRACTLGGMAANNASGPHAVRWGTTSAYVLGAEVVLADGSIITTGGVRSKALKSSSGIDLTKLFVGSEGTLGIFTRLRLRVQPRPPARAVILAGYKALEDTVASLDDLFEAGILPSTAELLDKSAVDALQLWRPELELPAGEAVLFIEVEGTPEQVAANVRYTDGIVRKRATVTRFAEDEKEITRLWAGRSGLAAATALAHPGKHRIFAGEDLAVPLSEIPQTVRRAREMGAELGIAVVFYGHFGDGNVHSAILVNPDDPDEVRRADELADRLHKLAIEVGGTVTGEHGTGAVRARYMRSEHGDALDVMKRIKNVMDPKGLLNPGKLYGP
jgi:glycolate oxidase